MEYLYPRAYRNGRIEVWTRSGIEIKDPVKSRWGIRMQSTANTRDNWRKPGTLNPKTLNPKTLNPKRETRDYLGTWAGTNHILQQNVLLKRCAHCTYIGNAHINTGYMMLYPPMWLNFRRAQLLDPSKCVNAKHVYMQQLQACLHMEHLHANTLIWSLLLVQNYWTD
jgi:hypothetical protein